MISYTIRERKVAGATFDCYYLEKTVRLFGVPVFVFRDYVRT